LIVWAVLWWWWPKFKIFLNTLSGRTPRKPETKNIQMILGFIVYAIILAPAAIATFIGGHCHHDADSWARRSPVKGSQALLFLRVAHHSA
jgi:hypothetical protein